MTPKKQTAAKSRPQEVVSHDWCAPVSADAPCGIDLEYDPEYVVMSARSTAQPDAQYGNFVGSADPVNWSDIDRDCRRLMLRTKDIRIAVLFTRCRTRLGGAAGLGEGIVLLARLLDMYPDAIHPQLAVDSDRDAALEIRANTLQALTDTEGLLSDLREVPLAKSTAVRLQVRDVERAFARPRPADALAPDSVTQQLDALREQNPASLAGFDQALASLGTITTWCELHLGSFAPDLSALAKLLGLLARPIDRLDSPLVDNALQDDAYDETAKIDASEPQTEAVKEHPEGPTLPDELAEPIESVQSVRSPRAPLPDRKAALEKMRQARLWFDTHEPSSPIPVLLKQAERLVGARYADILQAIPPDLLAQWDTEA
ncbi:type VI secretion system ImpA family N-terminal domain-containing protein [Caballeronia sp. LjRoot34]|uniref:type VI secretion system protein TssA n=1 Tax=Caballeronia sp. LjRoot34 TaxID=3342325 RepID=UPI003ECCA72A